MVTSVTFPITIRYISGGIPSTPRPDTSLTRPVSYRLEYKYKILDNQGKDVLILPYFRKGKEREGKGNFFFFLCITLFPRFTT